MVLPERKVRAGSEKGTFLGTSILRYVIDLWCDAGTCQASQRSRKRAQPGP